MNEIDQLKHDIYYTEKEIGWLTPPKNKTEEEFLVEWQRKLKKMQKRLTRIQSQ